MKRFVFDANKKQAAERLQAIEHDIAGGRISFATCKTTMVKTADGNGTPYSAGAFRRRLRRWCAKAKVPQLPPYALRHSFATKLAGDGTNMTIIGQLMGHTTLRTTQRYIANNSEYQQTAVERLSDRFGHLVEVKNKSGEVKNWKKVVTKVVTDETVPKDSETRAYVNSGRKAG